MKAEQIQLSHEISDDELDSVTGGARKSGEGQKEFKETIKSPQVGFAASSSF
jgi:bacteriocin-like protein